MDDAERDKLDEATCRDLADVESVAVVSSLLEALCRATGMRFSAVARVTETHWTALAVRDTLGMGVVPGQQLDIHTTLYKETRAARQAILIDQASTDPVYKDHHTPRIYGFESYVSVPIVLPGGEYFGNLCALDAVPIKVTEPHVADMFAIFADVIGANLHNIQSRRRATADAQFERASSLQRERFVAVLAHDLRNPLSAVTAGLQFVERSAGNAEMVRSVARRMHNSARRMQLLVDDVMDYARGRFGAGLSLETGAVADLDEAFTQVIEELRLAHPGRRLEHEFDTGSGFRGDRARLQQLLSNLVSNALTHGDANTPVSIRARRTEDGGLAVCVANIGDPIPAAQRRTLFDAFSFMGGPLRPDGLGLGLYICAEIVRGHGGTLTVAAEPGRRTVFQALLPAR